MDGLQVLYYAALPTQVIQVHACNACILCTRIHYIHSSPLHSPSHAPAARLERPPCRLNTMIRLYHTSIDSLNNNDDSSIQCSTVFSTTRTWRTLPYIQFIIHGCMHPVHLRVPGSSLQGGIVYPISYPWAKGHNVYARWRVKHCTGWGTRANLRVTA